MKATLNLMLLALVPAARLMAQDLASAEPKRPETPEVRAAEPTTLRGTGRIARAQRKLMLEQLKNSNADVIARVIPGSDDDHGVLKLFLFNPKQERLQIELRNQKNRLIYNRFEYRLQNYTRFVMDGMPAGDYQVRVFKFNQREPYYVSTVSFGYEPSRMVFRMKSGEQGVSNPLVVQKQ
ncbi:hypothetical protein [Larkinella soli]|uniref:hypothetical protein n=1 Tax=Larkinella soli TaxID=1770527 RepID=UPI000FFB91BE|nr:hypothetical protein [Larkinella soli]